MVFFLKKQISGNLQKLLTGFAAGVMVAASFWSLLQPALDSSEGMGKLSFLPAAIGFLIGIGFAAAPYLCDRSELAAGNLILIAVILRIC